MGIAGKTALLHNPSTVNDQEIIHGFLRRDPQAAETIGIWIARAASPFRRRLASNWDDIVQEVLLEVTRLLERGSFRGESSLKTYVWRVTDHACLKQLRAQTRVQWTNVEVLDDLGSPIENSPFYQLQQKEAERLLLKVMTETSEECRNLWQMILDGMSYQQMSEQVGSSEGSLRVKVLRCRKRALAMRDQLLGQKQQMAM